MCESHERLRDIQQYAIQLSDEARATVGQAADEIKRLMAKADNWQRIATEVTVSEHALRLDNERLEEEARNIHDQRLLDYEEIEQLRAALQTLVRERDQERKMFTDAIAAHLAEVERLHADNDALRRQAMNVEEDRYLRAENERLRAALQALADDTSVPPWIRTLAHRALEPKP